jgi:competence protein ComEC
MTLVDRRRADVPPRHNARGLNAGSGVRPLLGVWDRAPLLVFLAAGWIVGDVIAGHNVVLPVSLLAVGGAAGTVLCVAGGPMWSRVAFAVLASAVGYLRADQVYRPILPPDHIAAARMRVPVQLEGVLADDPERTASGVRLWLHAERVNAGQGWRAVRGQILLSLRQLEQTWYAGDRIRAPLSLRRPRNFGNPGEFDYEGYLARRGIYVKAFADDDALFLHVGHRDVWGAAQLAQWRRGVNALFHRVLPEPQSGVLSALIVGTQMELPRELRAAFSRAGVSHVLSISGLHVALVAAGGYAVFRWLLARSRWLLLRASVPKLSVGLSLLPVLLYAGIAGTNVATIRSVIMILVFLGAVIVDRQRRMIVSLAIAVIAILLYSPGAASDISFQLSFVAVLGLVLAMARFWPWWRQWEEARLVRLRGRTARLWRPLAMYAAVSFSACTATAPVTALHFNQVSLVALCANAVVVPLLGSVAVTLGLLAALFYLVAEPVAAWCAVAAGPFVHLGIWCVEAFAALPYAAIRVVTPTGFELAVLYAGLLALVCLSRRARLWSVALAGAVLLIDGAWWYMDRYHRSDLRITFLSIGQGDSAVVEFPGADVMIVDGGGVGGDAFDTGERVIAPFLWSRKIAHVDYLVLSHPDWDHYGGLAFLAAHFSPREFWSNGAPATSHRLGDLQHILAENGVPCLALHRGERRWIGAVEAAVRSPPALQDGLKANDQSLVFSLAFAGRRVLFTGDIEALGERRLVAADGMLSSTLLKAPHHGSRTSSSAPFLDAVAPRVVVVSAGWRNRFGFPHQEVLRRYAARQCLVLRTDVDGAVQVRVGADGAVAIRNCRDESSGRTVLPQVTVDSPVLGR